MQGADESVSGVERRTHWWGRPLTWILAGALIAAGGGWWLLADPAGNVLCPVTQGAGAQETDTCPVSCPYPNVRIIGGSPDQAGVVRCYLEGLADRNASELSRAIPSQAMLGSPSSHVKPAAFTNTVHARSGTVSVELIANKVDSADAELAIRFADGTVSYLEMHIVNPESAHSWRILDVNSPSPTGYMRR